MILWPQFCAHESEQVHSYKVQSSDNTYGGLPGSDHSGNEELQQEEAISNYSNVWQFRQMAQKAQPNVLEKLTDYSEK